MSRERASIPCFKEFPVGEHPDDRSGRYRLAFANPVATSFDIKEELAADDEQRREKAGWKGNCNTSITVQASCGRKKIDKFKIYGEWAVICTVIVVIWGLLTLPTIYYHMPQDPVASSGPVNNSNQCFSEMYVGNICMSALTARQKCIPDRCGNSEVYVRMSASQGSLELQVSSFLDRLQLLRPSPECRDVVGPFLCFYYFGLCDSSGGLYLPSSGECETITTETCAREFQIAVSVLGSANLPQCGTLSPTERDCNDVCIEDEDSECNATYSRETRNCTSRMVNDSDTILVPYERENKSGPNSNESLMPRPISCSQGFYVDNDFGLCRPECSKWENLPHHVELTTRVVAILGASVYIVSASVLLVLSCIHHKRMFKFPSVFIVYEMFPLGLFEVFLLISFTDTETLFCSKKDVIGSIKDSTPFCNIQGAVFHYVVLQQTLLWLFHILVVFWTLKWPFKNKYYLRYVHFVMIGIAIVLPFIPLAAVLGTGGSTLGSFPPYLCFARNVDVTYYTFILPASIMMGIGITLLILIFHMIVHMKAKRRRDCPPGQELRTERSLCNKFYYRIKKLGKLYSAEVKLVIISCYYVVFSVFIVTTFTITHVRNDMQFVSDITDYFVCESTGAGNECDRSFAQLSGEIFTVLTFIILGLYPIANLAYVVNIRELKEFSKHCSTAFKEQQWSHKLCICRYVKISE